MANIDELTVQFKAKGIGTVVKNINNLASAVENLSSKSQRLNASNLQALAGALNQLKGSIPTKGQITRIDSLASAIGNLNSAAGNGGNITTLSNNVAQLSNSLNNIKGSSANTLNNAAQAMNNVSQSAQQAANNVGKVTNAGGKGATINVNTAQVTQAIDKFRQLYGHISQTTTVATGLSKRLLDMKITVPTKQMESLQKQAENARVKYERLREAMIKAAQAGNLDPTSKGWEAKTRQLDAYRQKYQDLILMQKQLAQEGGGFQINPAISAGIESVKNSFKGLGSIISSASRYVDKFIGKLYHMATASKSVKKQSITLTDNIKKFANEIFRVSKMLKLMVTRMALRAVIANVGDGFKSLAIHSASFNQAISSLINSCKTLGYALASTFGRILEIAAPVLNTIINLLTRVVNLINQLFSALGGGSKWNKPKQFTDDYAASLQKATGAAKELKKTVLGFDELNQLQDNSSSGGGGAGDAIVDMFEDADIEPWILDLASKIKKWAEKLFAPLKAAWDKVGEWVKAKWKYAWEELCKLGASIARDFWKVWEQPETEQIFKNILIILGEIGRFIGNLARQFRIAWDENDTGLHILENIRDIILIITDHLRNMATYTADWAGSLDFSPLLTSIEEWLQSLEPAIDAVMGILEDFYKDVVLKFGKWVIESGLPDLIDVFKRFNDEVDWEGLRQKLKKLWEHLEPFMETVGEGLIIFIERVTTALADFINGEEFEDFLDKLEEWMDSVDPEDVADGIQKLIAAIIGLKVISTILPLLGGLRTAFSVLSTVVSGIITLFTILGGPAILAIGLVIAAGVLLVQNWDEIKEAAKLLVERTKEHWDNFKQKASDAFDSAKESVIDFAIGLGESVIEAKDDLVEFGQKVAEKGADIKAKFGEMKDSVSEKMQGIKDKVIEGTENVKTKFGEMADKVKEKKDDIKSHLDDFKTKASERFGDIQDKLTEFKDDWADRFEKAKEKLSTFKEDASKLFGDIKENIVKCFDGIKEGIKAPINAILGFIEKLVNGIINAFNNMGDKLGSIDIDVPDWIPEIGGKQFKLGLPHISTISIPRLKNGGMLEDGLFFTANHNELIGGFDNGKTVVANNNQIISGIEKGVYSAVSMAMQTSGGNEKYVVTEINVDGERLATAVSRGQDKQNRRYSPQTI